ncbi:hypothetical protein BU24DRAFT_466204 [Aaosphaeria arxii CBS 175.79]|uniref:2,6-dihydroxypyridine 3-monooxygenase substrate binding domain-containing protein n=1 Tax=Aaosphaeria arxii CBS 175.79 TaxID=1450172 RepID=A0A6A5XGL3_9PLEO|nr:uncharacterized protein BU24DRAFT_466204 [Aaosphaeria arxii CBS 175.79]KAF2011504.1 hypothetical protein BU24DRAFT_466204 [Aaosphaeria arxii CBS 175.79]
MASDGITSKAVPVAPNPEEGDGTVVFRTVAKVTDVHESGNSVQVDFEDSASHTIQTITGDLVIVADGSTSSIKKILLPGATRHFAGYISWRGAVPEHASKKYAEKFVFQLMNRNYLLHYTIPTDEGNLDPGKRLHNWIWYQRVNEQELNSIFTDINGPQHQGTVARGLLDPKIWEKQKAVASKTMPEELSQILHSTSSPFVSKIYDASLTKAVFFGEKLFLIGDALTTIRPNAGMSTTYAAYAVNELEKVVEGNQTPSR